MTSQRSHYTSTISQITFCEPFVLRNRFLDTYLKLCQLSRETGINYRESRRIRSVFPLILAAPTSASTSVVAARASFASPMEKFVVRLISVVNARQSRPCKPSEDGRAIHFATTEVDKSNSTLSIRIIRLAAVFRPVVLEIYEITFKHSLTFVHVL